MSQALPKLEVHLATLRFLKDDLAKIYHANPSDEIRLAASNISLDISPIENYLRSLIVMTNQVSAHGLQKA